MSSGVEIRITNMTTEMCETMQRRHLVILATAVILAVPVALHEPMLSAVGDFLVVQDQLQPADVIHVISGPDERADYAIDLFQQGLARQVFFTGGWCPNIQGNHAKRGQERAVAQGIQPQAIAIDGSEVTSTYAEAERLKAFIGESPVPIESVIVVSDPFHMRRAQWTYRQVLGDGVKLQMAPVRFGVSRNVRRWWTDSGSRQMVKDEYVKLVYYSLRYGLDWEPLTKRLAALDRD